MRNKDILVTGSSGFVGRHMVAELEANGNRVYDLDIKNGPDNDMNLVLNKINTRFDLVVHLAYHVGGRAAIDGSPMNLAANLHLDSLLFNWALKTRQKRVLYFSSSAAYPIQYQVLHGNPATPEYTIDLEEGHIVYGDAEEPDANYGWAKLSGERMAVSAMESGLRVHVVRPFSGYAEDQDLAYPFPTIIKRAKERKDPFDIWGSKHQIRDFIHITDVVKGALRVVDLDVDHPVNLCTGIETSLEQLVFMAASHAGYTPVIKELEDMPMGVFRRVGNPAKMTNFYRPQVTIEEGVARAMRWTPPSRRA